MAYMDTHEELHPNQLGSILLNEQIALISRFVMILGDEEHPEYMER